MKGRFIAASDAVREQLSWGARAWFSRPDVTEASHLTVVEVDLEPGQGHGFHTHPDQEEVLYVISGEVEQWIERESQILQPGDAVFINKDVVHASFNVSNAPARFIAILGPSVTGDGYVAVDVSTQEPWSSIRMGD